MSEVSLREADKLEVVVVVDNYADMLLESTEVAKRAQIPPERRPHSLLAEHGLSCLLKVWAGLEEHWVLMDAGLSATCLLDNMDAMEIDLSRVESIVLSHGHFDHFGGLEGLLGKVREGVPLTLHPDAFLEYRINIPAIGLLREMPKLDETALLETGVVLSRTKGASTLASDLVLVTGDVERTTDFEKGITWVEVKIDGEWVVDHLHHDQGL